MCAVRRAVRSGLPEGNNNANDLHALYNRKAGGKSQIRSWGQSEPDSHDHQDGTAGPLPGKINLFDLYRRKKHPP